MKPAKYIKGGEMVYDCKRLKHVIVFDVNLSGTHEHDMVSRRIHSEFPAFYKELLKRLYEESIYPGDSLVMNINSFTLVGLVNHCKPYRNDFDDKETVAYLTVKAIEDMLEKVDNSREFTSGIIGRDYGIWSEIFNTISKLDINWSVLPE